MIVNSGEQFELEIFSAVQEYVSSGFLGLLREACRVFHHKAYESRDRRSNIIFDVSIEVYMPGADEPHIIWAWECKDYRRLVEVGDVEQFHAKLEQIGADRTKGTMVTRSGFQEGAIEYARSKGIGLARVSQESAWIVRLRGIPPEFLEMLNQQGVMKAVLSGEEFFTRQTGIQWFALTSHQFPLWASSPEGFAKLQIVPECKHWGLWTLKDDQIVFAGRSLARR